MSLPLALGFYFVCWWLVFFAALPFARRHDEAEEANSPPGVERAAPTHFNFWGLVLVTTVMTSVIFFILYTVIESGLISLGGLPF